MGNTLFIWNPTSWEASCRPVRIRGRLRPSPPTSGKEPWTMSGRTVVQSAPGVPVPLALTARRHIDLARVSSATCR